MRNLALTLVISAMAATAHAGGDRVSSLQCGINMGGKSLTYKTSSEAKNRRDNRMDHVAGAVQAETVRFATASTATTPVKREVRLPSKITVAIIGCSWR